MEKLFNNKWYEESDYKCPACGEEFDDLLDEADHVSEPIQFYNGSNDCFIFDVFVTCSKCGKKYFFEDGN